MGISSSSERWRERGERDAPEASLLAADSSSLLAKNLVSFLPLITGENGEFAPNFDDEIVAAMTLTRDGETVHATLKEG